MSSQSQAPNNSIIIRNFEGDSIDFIKDDRNKIWLTARTIAKGLGIDRRNVNQSYHKNKVLLGPHSAIIQIMTPQGTRQKTRVFDKTAFIWICVRSNSPKALPFQEWVLNVIDEILNKGYYIEKKEVGSTDWIIQQLDVMKSIALKQQEYEKKLDNIDSELKTFEQKYEDDRPITPDTMYKIKDIVHESKLRSDKHYLYFWNLIWKEFRITTTKRISEKLAQKIIKWLENHPEFYVIEEF